MPAFELRLRAAAADADGAPTTFSFALEPGGEIVFGRAHGCDIQIPDEERKVSSRHGRLVCEPHGGLRAYDLGSLNGTLCNGEALDVEQGRPFAPGDALQVGEWLLEVAPDPASELDATICSVDIKGTASRLAQALATSYDEGLQASVAARRQQMQEQVDEALAGLRPPEVQAVLGELQAAFGVGDDAPLQTFAQTVSPAPSSPTPSAVGLAPPLPATVPAPPGSDAGGDGDEAVAASQALVALAERLVPGRSPATEAALGHLERARVAGHDQDDVAEVGLAPVVSVSVGAVHDLQQDLRRCPGAPSRSRRAPPRCGGSCSPRR